MIKAKKDEIFKLFQTARIQSFSGNLDNGEVLQEGKHSLKGRQGKEIDRTRTAFDMMNVLSPPAMQARYFVARLVGSKRASPLHMAAEKGQTNLVKVLLDWGANINATDANWQGGTALPRAARQGHIEVVKLLLDRGAAIDATTNNGWAAHHWAAHGGHIEVVKVMLDRGAAIDARAGDGWTALHQAARDGHIEVVKVLLDRGAAIDATVDYKGVTALHQAALWGHIEVVKLMLDKGAAIDAMANYRFTAPCSYPAADRGHIEVVEVPLDRGAAIDATTNEGAYGWTALHLAALAVSRL